MGEPQPEYNGGGAMICMPVIFAYPCGCCGNPGQLCPTCPGAFCSGCAHGCDGLQGDYDDSPWGSDIEMAPPPGETGGSGETDFHQTTTKYADLVPSYLNPNAWTLVEEGLFIRCQMLTELNTCYIHDGEVDDSRRFGSIRDWRRVGDFMAWHHPVIVLVNAVVQKTMVFEVGRAPAARDLKQALRELRANPNWLGFICHGEEHEPSFLHMEVWWMPEESKVSVKRCIVRDKLLRAVLKMNKSVSFWRP